MSSYDVSTGRQAQSIELTDSERSLMERLFANPSLWPDSAKVWIADYVSQNSLLPISQVQGFTQYVASQSTVATSEATTSTSFTDLATVGPAVTGLSPGTYVIVYGAKIFAAAAEKSNHAGVEVAGVAAGTNSALFSFSGPGPSWASEQVTSAEVATIATPNASVTMKYKSGDGTSATYSARWLIVVRIANP